MSRLYKLFSGSLACLMALLATLDVAAQNTCGLTVTYNKTDVGCYNTATGSIDLTVTGGSGNYAYYWGNGYETWNTQDLTGIITGTYRLKVVDLGFSGCYSQLTIDVLQPNPLTLSSFTRTRYLGYDLRCSNSNDGTFRVNVSGGTAPYTYSVNGVDFQASNQIGNLAAGTYYVTVKDARGCMVSNDPSAPYYNPEFYSPGPVTLIAPSPLVVTPIMVNPVSVLSTGVNAYTIYLGYALQELTLWAGDISGGAGTYTYSWSPGANLADSTSNVVMVSPTVTTTYTLTVTDGNGCTTLSQVTINVVNISGGGGTDTTSGGGGGSGGGTGSTSKTLFVCHNGQSLEISRSALQAHIRHGDGLGPCATVSSARHTEEEGIDEYQAARLTVSPNPARGPVAVRLAGYSGSKAELSLLNAAGLIMEKRMVTLSRTGAPSFNTSHLAAGLYYVRVVTADGRSHLSRVLVP